MFHARPIPTLTALVLALAAPLGAQTRFVDGLPGSFIDISATGVAVTPTVDGEFDIVSTIGNTRVPPGLVRIGANGGARFGPSFGDDLAASNQPIPNITAFGGSIALLPYWDDFGSALGSFGTIHHQQLNGMLIIQWTDVHLRSAPFQSRVTFQLQVPSSGTVHARFVYEDIEDATAGGIGATIGYQGTNLVEAAQYSVNTHRSVRNGTVLSLIDAPAFGFATGVPGTFIDIASTGTILPLSVDGSVALSTNLRNAIVQQSELIVSMNGGIRLSGSNTFLAGTNVPLPSALAFQSEQALLPFWDDLESTGLALARVFAEERPDRLIVQWNHVGFAGGPATERATFQVQVFDEGDILAQFLYQDVEGARADRGGSATIGYQAAGNLTTLTHSFDQPILSNGEVLTLYRILHIGANYCVANPNSTGLTGAIEARGSDLVPLNSFRLNASALPPQAAALFLVGTLPGFTQNPGGSQGNICLSGIVGRGIGGVLNTGASGAVGTPVNLTALPSPAGPFAVTSGTTLNFQCWFRDAVGGVATSNFTDAVQIRFRG